MYLGCRTQWIKSVGWANVRWEGLNYTGVEIVMRRYQVPPEKESEVFTQLQVLELETLAIRNSD